MALGGGTFTTQNKKLPGTYMNFVSAARASAELSDRGYVTFPLELDWGPEEQIFTVTSADFQTNALKIFGYSYTSDKMKGLRDLFMNAQTLYSYRLNGGGAKASNTFATAKYAGTRGNDLATVITVNVDNADYYDVDTYLGDTKVDSQTAKTTADLTDNDFVTWIDSAVLKATAKTSLTGGTNGEASGDSYTNYLTKIEPYSFNIIASTVTDESTKKLFVAFTKRMHDQVGVKFQCVLYNYTAADYEGCVSVKNKTTDSGWPESSAVYWTAGAEAGCKVNRTLQNRKYDGEFTLNTDYKQSNLEDALAAGEFVFHKVGDDVRVLSDINTMVTTSDTHGDIFKENQTIRVCDQIANDIASLFNTKYLGTVPNDAAGRLSLWSDIVKHHQKLADIRAIEDFTDSDITVSQGDTKKSVVVADAVTVVNAMDKLYMTVKVA